MKLFTVSVDSEDFNEGEWNDLLYVAAEDKNEAVTLAEDWVMRHRATREIVDSEAHEYKGESKVLASYDPDEED